MAKSKKSSKAQAPKLELEEVKEEAPKAQPKPEVKEEKLISIVDVDNMSQGFSDLIGKYILQQRKLGYPASRLEKQRRDLKRFRLSYKVSPKQQ